MVFTHLKLLVIQILLQKMTYPPNWLTLDSSVFLIRDRKNNNILDEDVQKGNKLCILCL